MRAFAALFVIVIAACHTPEWRVAQIHEEIFAANFARREAAIAAALAANQARRENAKAMALTFGDDVDACTQPEVTVSGEDHMVFTVDCNAFRNALLTGGAVDATREDGSSVVLAAAHPLRGDPSGGFELATSTGGATILIRPRMTVVLRRKIWREGTCNFMPSPVHLSPSASMFVLFGRRATDIRAIDVTYEGQDTEVICDARVE